ncbi:hypothetical protein BT63DRAFT_421650 [Microthyrium microscopicum]|uniref:Uncharacterized protein n=1 Tax=Microthyrium microscopicum TaxID=703497 RepID=A0A6A6URG6_9PEZI|nr:hypothetical protein BT63DRAFT_421650 [Microthyrium microscopicum]
MLKSTRPLRFALNASRFAKPPPTHFSATGPFANAAPEEAKSHIPTASTVQIRPAKSNETPRQRVERLRQAARASQLKDLPWTEKLIERGRVIADYGHRTFTGFLILSSVIIAGFTVFALYDMISFNKKKQSSIRQEKQRRNEEALIKAMKDAAAGKANVKQKVLLKRYQAVKDAEDERIASRGSIARTLDWVFPGIMGKQSEAKLVMKLDSDIMMLLESGQLENFVEEEAKKAEEPAKEGQKKSWKDWLLFR